MRAFFFGFLAFALASCFDQGDCLYTNTTDVKVVIKDLTATSKSKTVKFDSIFTPGVPAFYKNKDLASLSLPVNPEANETTFVFRYTGKADTLVFSYSSQTLVLSPECGSFLYQNNLQVTTSTFDAESVRIINQKLLQSVSANVEILL